MRLVSVGLLGVILAGCSGDPPAGGGATAGASAGGNSSTTAGTGSTTGGTSAATTGGTSAATAGGTTAAATGGTSAATTGGASAAGTGGTSTATTGGTAATGGSGGAVSAGGMGGTGGRPSGPSAGCMKAAPNETPGTAALHTIDVTGMADRYLAGYTHRKYCTTMPQDYDPTKPYPVVFYGPGCGASACEGSSFSGRSDVFVVQAISGADAKGENLVPKNGAPGCFQAGKEGTGDSPEGPYFDQVMAVVEDTYCIDRGKIFAAGTSSGAWLSNYLACARGNVIRGTAADSGGLQFDHGTCTGGAAVMNLPGDASSAHDQAGHEIGVTQARDMFIQLNGCSATPTMMSFGKANNCQVYGNCASPVVLCDVGGGHQSGNNLLAATGMAFWSTLQ